MKNKGILSGFIAFIIILQMLIPENFAFAEGGEDVTEKIDEIYSSIKIIADGEEINPNENGEYENVPLNSKIKLGYELRFNNDYDYSQNDFVKINFPSLIKFNKQNIPIKNDNGDIMAYLNLYENEAIVVFTEIVEEIAANIYVGFEIEGYFDLDEINSENKTEIDLEYVGEVIIDFKDSSKASVKKETPQYDYDKQELTWKITVMPEGEKVWGVKIIDEFTDNQEFVEGSFKVNGHLVKKTDVAEYFENGKLTTGSALTIKDNKITYIFPEAITDSQIIEYKTKPIDTGFLQGENIVTYKNTVKVYVNEEETGRDSSYLNMKKINKEGGIVNTENSANSQDSGKVIQWVVTVNNFGGQYNNNSMEDVLHKYLKLIEKNSEYPIKAYYDGDLEGETVQPGIGNDISGMYTLEDLSSGQSKFTYYFRDKDWSRVKLTFYTKVQDEYYENEVNNIFKFENTVKVGVDSCDSNILTLPTVPLSKSGYFIDKQKPFNGQDNNLIEWKLNVNSRNITMEDITVEDILPEGLEYVPYQDGEGNNNEYKISYSYQDKGKYDDSNVKFSKSTDENILTWEINKLDYECVITFLTKISDEYYEKIYNGTSEDQSEDKGYDFLNTVNLYFKDKKATAYAMVNVRPQLINKVSRYNYNTKVATWDITVNESELTLEDVVVTDKLPKGLSYIKTLSIIDSKGNNIKDIEPEIYETEDEMYVTYYLGNINSRYTITFETLVEDEYLIENAGNNIKFANFVEIKSTLGKKNKTVELEIKNPVIEKNAEVGYDFIKWIVPMNISKIKLKEVTVSDKLQKGLTLVKNSVELYNLNILENGDIEKGELVSDDIYEYTYNETNNELEIKIYEMKDNAYQLEFVTETSENKMIVNNTINFKGSGVEINTENKSKEIKMENWKAYGGGTKGKLTVLKVDNEDNPLTGAKFELHDNNGKKYSSISMENKIVFEKLPFRKLTLVEIDPPTGYILNSEEIYITLNDRDSEQTIKVENKKVLTNVKFNKTDEEKSFLEHAIFELENEKGEVIQTVESDKDGIIEFKNLEIGKYLVKETKAPQGYQKSDKVAKVNIKYNDEKTDVIVDIEVESKNYENGEYTFVNNKIPEKKYGSLRVIKSDINKKLLKGAEFALYNKQGLIIKQGETNENGILEFFDIEYGEYLLKEIKAPDGYKLTTEEMEITIKDGESNKVIEVKNENAIANIKFKKADEKGRILTNAIFELIDENDKTIQTSISDKNGIVEFKNVQVGNYTVKEFQAPTGYSKSDEIANVSIKYNDEKTDVIVEIKVLDKIYDNGDYTFVNKSIPPEEKEEYGDIKIIKTNLNKEVLQGAEFELYDEKGDLVKRATTDEKGILEFTKLSYGKYILKESMAPKGYKIILDEIDVIIKEDDPNKLIEVKNEEAMASVKFNKTDEKGLLLENAVFELWDKENKIIQTTISTKDGLVEFKNILVGEYIVKESESPNGYEKSDKVFEVIVEYNQDKTDVIVKIIADKEYENGQYTFVNIKTPPTEEKYGDIKIVKKDSDKNTLKGAEFELYNKNGELIRHGTTNSDGILKFTNLPEGNYILKEVKAPDGYKLEVKDIVVEVVKDLESSYTIINDKEDPEKPEEPKDPKEPKDPEDNEKPDRPNKEEPVKVSKGSLEIFKTDNSGEKLEGAVFRLYTKDSKVIREAISDKEGKAYFTNLDFDEYILIETRSPVGYILDEEEVIIDITKPETVEYVFINEEDIGVISDGGEINPEDDPVIEEENFNNKKLEDKIPNTGYMWNTTLFLIIGFSFILTGGVLLRKIKEKEIS